MTIKPCPFCGGDRVSTHEGSTFRWIVAECNECGARAGEVRRNATLNNDAADEAAAIRAWNKRTKVYVDAPDRPG